MKERYSPAGKLGKRVNVSSGSTSSAVLSLAEAISAAGDASEDDAAAGDEPGDADGGDSARGDTSGEEPGDDAGDDAARSGGVESSLISSEVRVS